MILPPMIVVSTPTSYRKYAKQVSGRFLYFVVADWAADLPVGAHNVSRKASWT